MGVDSRGVERGKCTKCDCEEYEVKDRQNECGYCGCFPAQHEQSRSESSECQDIAEQEVPKTEGTPKWMNTYIALFNKKMLFKYHFHKS